MKEKLPAVLGNVGLSLVARFLGGASGLLLVAAEVLSGWPAVVSVALAIAVASFTGAVRLADLVRRWCLRTP